MARIDPIFAAVTATGSPFEIGERNGVRYFAKAPPDINMLIESARRHGDKTFIVEGERRYSFEDVFQLRDALVPLLDINRGDRVAICMRNRAEWMIAFLAVQRAGGISALVNSRGSPAELSSTVADVGAELVLADSERAQLLRQGGFAGCIIEAQDFPSDGEALGEFPSADKDDPCAILFTSGTTGRVKGAVLSHENLITGIMAMQLSGLMVLHNMAKAMSIPVETILANLPQQAVLQVYPLFHISGVGAAFLSPLFAGTKIVIMPRWNAEEAMQLIEKEGITQFTAVPTMLWDMVAAVRKGSANLASLRNIGTGGQALPVNLLDAIREICPQAVMGTGYGMTECSGSVAMAVGEDFVRNRAAAGRVLNLVDMRIEDADGNALPVNQTGEIVVRGAMVMQGYWNQPEATAEVLSDDGWLRTGDVGYVDEEGYVFIVDRKKDMVISGGENIYCAEVERVMNEIPEISECAAFGIPDERLGELLVAVVSASGVTEEGIKAEVGEKLARYKAPGHVAFVNDPLPRNAVGKVDKNKLRAMWPALIGEAAHADAN
jgi:acyl-CoA synthetase (AMP-forming)/AMP-acid ligase II